MLSTQGMRTRGQLCQNMRESVSPAPVSGLSVQAIQAQKLAIEVSTETTSGKSARAAAVAVHTVQQLAALLQIDQVSYYVLSPTV